jgi:GT2 family glycosyltransferase
MPVSGKVAFVVATKDRPRELARMLQSLRAQTRKPDQVVIVDGGADSFDSVVAEFPELPVDYARCLPPSASKQRNAGVRMVKPDMDLVGFLDDDVVLESDAIEAMMRFWEHALEDVGGAAFNMTNHPALVAAPLKRSGLAERLGLYSRKRGAVLRSGFQTMVGVVDRDLTVEWLSSGASVWRRPVLDENGFDEWFGGYSYLEDLDFSYRVGLSHNLVVVAAARFEHLPAPSGRGNGFVFGRREIRNRLHFVRKYPGLSVTQCVVSLLVRTSMNFAGVFHRGGVYSLQRFLGNLAGLALAGF